MVHDFDPQPNIEKRKVWGTLLRNDWILLPSDIDQSSSFTRKGILYVCNKGAMTRQLWADQKQVSVKPEHCHNGGFPPCTNKGTLNILYAGLARSWRVGALVELCCCKAAPEKTGNHVAGWCIPEGDGRSASKIAIRLRRPKGKGHSLLHFENVFGTMLHELAHIVHSKHTPAFYQLMDELKDQWEKLTVSGCVLDAKGFPTVGGQAVDSSRHNPTGDSRTLAAKAAEKRQELGNLMSSRRFGA